METNAFVHCVRLISAWVFVFASACWVGSAPSMAAEPGPYRLTSESDVDDPAYAARIEEFWKSRGVQDRFQVGNRPKIAFVTFLQERRSAERGAIVISSGRTETYLKYKELIFDLWNNGYSVYIPDHRGQGFSEREEAIQAGCKDGKPDVRGGKSLADCQKGHVGDFNDFVEDLDYFVNAHAAKGGHQNLFLLAHSMGGAIASLYLEKDPQSAARIFKGAAMSSPMHKIKGILGQPTTIFTCPSARVISWFSPTGYAVTQHGYSPAEFLDNEYTHSERRYRRFRDEYARHSQVQLGGPTHAWIREACRGSNRAAANASRIEVPLMLFQAGSDSIVHPAGHEQFCDQLKLGKAGKTGCGGENGGPIVVAGARHELFIEEDRIRTDVLTRILSFFDRLRKP